MSPEEIEARQRVALWGANLRVVDLDTSQVCFCVGVTPHSPFVTRHDTLPLC